MRTLGLIGGMSWVSSAEYYRIINLQVKERLGRNNSCPLVMYSVNFEMLWRLHLEGEWGKIKDLIVGVCKNLVNAGAECMVLCSNTIHIIAEEVQEAITVPLLHIAEVTGRAIVERGFRKVGLLGTKPTMESDFFTSRLQRNFGLETTIPNDSEREFIHNTIVDELCKGIFVEPTRARFRAIIASLAERGIEGIVLGCTEIPLLVKPEDSLVPLFDTTFLHATAAAEFALGVSA